jgi:hypothetical protein
MNTTANKLPELKFGVATPRTDKNEPIPNALVNYCELFRLDKIYYIVSPEVWSALVGVDEQRQTAVYEFNALIGCLVKRYGITPSEATEYVANNIENAPNRPAEFVIHEWNAKNCFEKNDVDRIQENQ